MFKRSGRGHRVRALRAPWFNGGASKPPLFRLQPSIIGRTQVGQALSGLDGDILRGTVVSRRWLLGGVQVSTAQVYVATTPGTLVYEVTAEGPGGPTVASSSAVTVTAASAVGAMPAYVWQNLAVEDVTDSAFGAAVLNKMYTARPWSGGGGDNTGLTTDARGFPISFGAQGYNQTIANVENGAMRPGVTRQTNVHVLESNCGCYIWDQDVLKIISDTAVNGVRRIEFVPDWVKNDGHRYANGVEIIMPGGTLPPGGNGFCHLYHKLDEDEFKAYPSRIYRQQFIDRVKDYGGYRFMDWCGIKSDFGNAQVNFSQYQKKNSVSWAGQVPLEHQIGLCNLNGRGGWFCVPDTASNDYCEAFGAKLADAQDGLRSDLVGHVELSNEVWDSNSPQYIRMSNGRYPQIDPALSNDKAWGCTGWAAANAIAHVLRGAGFATNLRGTICFQATNDANARGVMAGVERWIADVSTVGGPYYDADFAARFKYPGQLFPCGGTAPYLGAGMGRPGWPDNDKATFLTWARATDDSGLAAFFRQLNYGDVISDPSHFNISGIAQAYQPIKAVLDKYQIRWTPYETCVCVEDFTGELDAEMIAFRTRAMRDPRIIPTTVALWDAFRDLDVIYGANLCELSGPAGAYGSRENPFDGSYAREQGLLQVNAKPPAPKPLHASYVEAGVVQKGLAPTYTVTATGGRGLIRVEAVTAAPGQFVDFRTLGGVITEAGDFPIRLKITDEFGSDPFYLDIAQTVTERTTVPASRYYRFTITDSIYQDRVGSAEFRFNDANGPIAPTGWTVTATADSYDNPSSRLIDGDTASAYISDGKGAGCVIVVDTKVTMKPVSIDIFAFPNIGGYSVNGMLIEASADGVTWGNVSRAGPGQGWDFGGYKTMPLDFSGTVA